MNLKIFDKDMWQEAYITISQQKWRSLLTMFGVFWGLFMLVVLLGCGIGMNNGIMGNLIKLASNSVYVLPQMTNRPYNGLDRDRSWKINKKDIADIKKKSGDRLDYITLVNLDDVQLVANQSSKGYYTVGGVSTTYFNIVPQKVIEGRYLNEFDIEKKRKVCVIGQKIAKELYGGDSPCGKYISVSNIDYLIVGVVKQTNNQTGAGLPATESVQIPVTTEQTTFDHSDEYGYIVITYKDAYPIGMFIDDLIEDIKINHSIHPEDKAAIQLFNVGESVKGFMGLEIGINILLWIVGIGTLLAGLIGISNIMIITIKERVQEIGIRRALGAEPKIIILQIMTESLLLTVTAGLLGIVLGAWFLIGMNASMANTESNGSFMENPMVPLQTLIVALFILVASGLLAGYFPAKRAMKIKAIEALREE